jgi:hypothetical protein
MLSCLDQHAVCHAECCRYFTIINPDGWPALARGQVLRIPVSDPSLRWYYRLHGLTLSRGILTIPLTDFHVVGDTLFVNIPCTYLLPNNCCRGHPDHKPKVCIDFNEATCRDGHYHVPDTCLYKTLCEVPP